MLRRWPSGCGSFFGVVRSWLDGSWLLNVIHSGASEWDQDTTKAVAWFFMFSTTLWFIIGLVDPRLRFM